MPAPRIHAPELTSQIWLNVPAPLTLAALRGKVVLLDFWTYGCINCMHILPGLRRLEEKYRDELVVIGVHSGKFDAERNTENIRKKVAEYRIKHPVVNDAEMIIWERFGVSGWPTLALIDPDGNYVGAQSGEGNYALFDRVIGELADKFRRAGKLNEKPIEFASEESQYADKALLFPGKILADARGDRLFISDTGHNRIIQTDLNGGSPVVIGDGGQGLVDGPFDKARFNRQQGLCLAELHMHRGLAAAQDVVVHAGHVVVHERVGMDQLHCARCAQRCVRHAPIDIRHRREGRVHHDDARRDRGIQMIVDLRRVEAGYDDTREEVAEQSRACLGQLVQRLVAVRIVEQRCQVGQALVVHSPYLLGIGVRRRKGQIEATGAEHVVVQVAERRLGEALL